MHLAGFSLVQIPEVSHSAKFHEKMKGLGGFLCCVGDSWGCECFNAAKTRRLLSARTFTAKACKVPMV